MKKVAFIIAFCAAFVLGVSWGKGDSGWKSLGKYEIAPGEWIEALCDGERENVVYVTRIHWGDKTLGYIPSAPISMPDKCKK